MRSPDRSGHALAIGWPLWAEGGMQIDASIQKESRELTGLWPLPSEVALDLLARAVPGSDARFAVAYGDPEKLNDCYQMLPKTL